MRGSLVASTLLAGSVLLGACGEGAPAASSAADDPIDGTVTVLAAASLTDALTEIADAFESHHPGVDVAVTFDASSALATQIQAGVPADVFASADQSNLDKVIDSGDAAGEPVEFAANRLQIVVAEGNPLGIDGLEDLRGDLRLALCAPEVPCGRYSAQAFEQAALPVPAASQEENVRGVLTKVSLGEADAGIVYVTDVLAGERVEGVDLAAEHQVLAVYPATLLADAPNPEAADAFLAFLRSEPAVQILASYGFGRP